MLPAWKCPWAFPSARVGSQRLDLNLREILVRIAAAIPSLYDTIKLALCALLRWA